MAKSDAFNLFVYGTLMSPWVFRAVLGKELVTTPDAADAKDRFFPRPAVLNGYAKISPDQTYLYAVPEPHSRIDGYLIGPLPAEALKSLRQYEGRNYSQKRTKVHTADGHEPAVVFVGNLKELTHEFGHEFRDRFKQEVLLEKKIDHALAETQRELLADTDPSTRRALAELHGDTIRGIVRRHFEAGGISDYAIRHSFLDVPLPSFAALRADPHARQLAPVYLRLIIRQVIFNELEDRIYHGFRYELDHIGGSADCYERSTSSLIALRMLNTSPVLDRYASQCLAELSFDTHDLMDYTRWAVAAADGLYDSNQAQAELAFIQQHTCPGRIRLGTELEFSNIGHGVILDPQGQSFRDDEFDGFYYFYEFALDSLMSKLGGHIDDHHEKRRGRPRRGFLETALGVISFEDNLSQPVTTDPWLLNQLIHELRTFIPVMPHSVHLSLQVPSRARPSANRALPLEIAQCLLALGSEMIVLDDGQCVLTRLIGNQMHTDGPQPKMLFSELRRRHRTREDDSHALLHTGGKRGNIVQQFKFLQLSEAINYELLAVALKGIQLSCRPGSFLLGGQYGKSPRLRQLADALPTWATDLTPLGSKTIKTFLDAVRAGLMEEAPTGPAHSLAYITWSINQLDKQLKAFDAAIRQNIKKRACF